MSWFSLDAGSHIIYSPQVCTLPLRVKNDLLAHADEVHSLVLNNCCEKLPLCMGLQTRAWSIEDVEFKERCLNSLCVTHSSFWSWDNVRSSLLSEQTFGWYFRAGCYGTWRWDNHSTNIQSVWKRNRKTEPWKTLKFITVIIFSLLTASKIGLLLQAILRPF